MAEWEFRRRNYAEDENPNLEKGAFENYLYFTLTMVINYQRNYYTLWECDDKTYQDEE